MEGFKTMKDAHFTFFGTGNTEEDLSLNLIISRFLQSKFKYISLLAGGYSGIERVP
jgi:hypothetical protein